ncbi:hypothetical protein [Paracoccus aerodenitrificans]|uniref:hypothetical protein n=1 Tax=Paracoccus aerodenitrificans TaxID=3017781 RepID=UPI0022F119B5|nr:hypothetical protein [Paracoccus aerodenitrificans]WBU62756.1 hypothetical protein PAE61_10250 [Paracoccus aerodenitrificans]
MLRDAWDMRLAISDGEKYELQSQIKKVDREIESLLDRIVDATNASVVRAYEARIKKLERQKIVLAEWVETAVQHKGWLKDCIAIPLNFLSNLWNIYKNGDFVMRQMVLRLVFVEPLICGQNRAYRTT